MATDYELSKWRRLVLLADAVWDGDRRVSECVMCRGRFQVFALQAHHILPKSLYPALALDVSNGVTLCVGCHLGTVHAGSSWLDIKRIGNWERFEPLFSEYVHLRQKAGILNRT